MVWGLIAEFDPGFSSRSARQSGLKRINGGNPVDSFFFSFKGWRSPLGVPGDEANSRELGAKPVNFAEKTEAHSKAPSQF